MTDPIYSIPQDSRINAMIDLARDGQFKTMLKDVNKQLKKTPRNQFWRVLKAYALAYTKEEKEAKEILDQIVKEEIRSSIIITWVYYGYRALKCMDGYCNAVKVFYDKEKTNEDRINERFLIAQIEKDYDMQVKLSTELIKKHPNDVKLKEQRTRILAENPMTRKMARMTLERKHTTKGEMMLYMNILQEEKVYDKMIELYEEMNKSSVFDSFDKRENKLLILETLELNKQFELIPEKVLQFLEEYKDEDYTCYTVLLHALEHLDQSEKQKWRQFVEERKQLELRPTMKRSIYLFIVEYEMKFGNQQTFTEAICEYLKQFEQLRTCPTDLLPKLSNEQCEQLIESTKEFGIFNMMLRVKTKKELTDEEIEQLPNERIEKQFIAILNLINRYEQSKERIHLLKGIEICQKELEKNLDEHEFHMLQLQCYRMLGMRNEAVKEITHERMDIKDVLYESLGYLIFPLFSAMGYTETYDTVKRKYINFHNDHGIFMKDNVNQAIDETNWERYNELFEYENDLKHSSLKAAVTIADILKRCEDILVHSFENSKFLKPKCLDKINRKSFGQYIKKCRKAKNMKQSDVALAMDMQVKSISCFERGDTYPSQDNIFKLALLLDMSLDEYVFGYKLGEENISIREINELLSELSNKKKSFLIATIKNIGENLKEI